MVSRAPSWTLFYKNLQSSHDLDQKMDKIMDFNAATVTERDWISNLVKNPGLTILLVDGFGKLVLLHNMNYLHKSLFCDEEKVLGLCGSGKHAEVFRVSPLSASSTVELIVPSW